MSEVISTVDGILYNTDEIRYTTAENYDDEGKLIGETAEAEPTPCQKTASCKLYEAEVWLVRVDVIKWKDYHSSKIP